jgi:WD40 repeat protein
MKKGLAFLVLTILALTCASCSLFPVSRADFSLKNESWPITAMAFVPGSDDLVIAAQDGSLTVWDVDAREAVQNLPGSGVSIPALAFSPDGSLLALAGDPLRILETGTYTDALHLDAHLTTSVAFSPDGSILATGDALSNITLWDLEERDRIVTRYRIECSIKELVFSPDGRYLAAGTDCGLLAVLRADTLGTIRMVQLTAWGGITDLFFTPDGRNLLAGDSSSSDVIIWDTSKWSRADSFYVTEHSFVYLSDNFMPSIALSPDGRRLYVSTSNSQPDPRDRGTVSVWDTTTWSKTGIIEDNGRHALLDLAVSPSGHYVAGSSYNGRILIWIIE